MANPYYNNSTNIILDGTTADASDVENKCDDIAVGFDGVDTAVSAVNSVPTPLNPADDDKVLTASGGAFSWVDPAGSGVVPIPADPGDDGKFLQANSGVISWEQPDKTDVGLGNVDNTSDADKPVSTAQQTAIDNAIDSRNQNIIINGSFDVWQDGTTVNPLSNGTYGPDMFVWSQSGSMIVDAAKSTVVPNVAQTNGKSLDGSFFINVATADASIAAGDFSAATALVEGYEFSPYFNKELTLSFWVRATKTGIYCVSFRNDAIDRSYVSEYTINITDTWEKKTITFTHDDTGTWENTTDVGIRVSFIIAAGTSFHTTADTWQAGNFLATSNQVNGVDSNSNVIRFADVRLVEGDSTDNMTHRSFAEEEFNAQRYYFNTTQTTFMNPRGLDVYSSFLRNTYNFPRSMRSAPSITLGAASNITGISAATISRRSFNVLGTGTAGGTASFAGYSADARL